VGSRTGCGEFFIDHRLSSHPSVTALTDAQLAHCDNQSDRQSRSAAFQKVREAAATSLLFDKQSFLASASKASVDED
jgi:hypothetical protein